VPKNGALWTSCVNKAYEAVSHLHVQASGTGKLPNVPTASTDPHSYTADTVHRLLSDAREQDPYGSVKLSKAMKRMLAKAIMPLKAINRVA